MSLQALTSQYPRTASVVAQRAIGAATLSSAARQAIASTAVNPGDTIVSISPEARQLEETGLPGWVNKRMERLRADPDPADAMEYVEMKATLSRGPLVSVPDEYGRQYFTYTGERVTPESLRRYAAIEEASIAETTRILRTGKAKGSSAAEIFEETQRHMATLPDDYLRILDWFRPNSGHSI
jgi:hypothetical protein